MLSCASRRRRTVAFPDEESRRQKAFHPPGNYRSKAYRADVRRRVGTQRIHAGDCQFLDGTSAGGLARVMLASDYLAAGRTGATKLFAEVRSSYADGIDFEGTPLIDIVEKLERAK